MTILKDRLQDIYNQLSSLLLQLSNMGVNNLQSLPSQINKISVGDTKLLQRLKRTLQEVTA